MTKLINKQMKKKIAIISFDRCIFIDPRIKLLIKSLETNNYDVTVLDFYNNSLEASFKDKVNENKIYIKSIKYKEIGFDVINLSDFYNNKYQGSFKKYIDKVPLKFRLKALFYLKYYEYYKNKNFTLLDLYKFLDKKFIESLKSLNWWESRSKIYERVINECSINFDKFDFVIGTDINANLLSYFISNKYKIEFISDFKELCHKESLDEIPDIEEIKMQMEQKIMGKSSFIMCVSEGIIDYYKKIYPEYKNKFIYIPNTQSKNFHIKVKEPKKKIKCILIANFFPKIKGIEYFIKAWEILHRKYKLHAQVDIYLSNLDKYNKEKLIKLCGKSLNTTLFLKKSISLNLFNKVIGKYDVGIIPYLSEVINYEFCSPNKFGQYLQNGLSVLSSNTTNLSNYIHRNEIGETYTQNNLQKATVEIFTFLTSKKIFQYKINSYNFYKKKYNWENFEKKIIKKIQSSKLHVLIIHGINFDQCSRDLLIPNIIENLTSFGEFSKFNIDYISLTNIGFKNAIDLNLDKYQIIVFHFYKQVYTNLYFHQTNDSLQKKIRNFKGVKVFFSQDEYDFINENTKKYSVIRPDIIFSACAINNNVKEYLYPKNKLKFAKIINTLPAYVNKKNFIHKKIKDRGIDIFYRGNDIGFAYGELGFKKYLIGKQFKKHTINSDFNIDIKLKYKEQLQGKSYLNMLQNSKSTLITESGSSNISNNPKHMKDKMKILSECRDGEKIEDELYLRKNYKDYFSQEGKVVVNTLPPKAFEAALTKTVMIGLRGEYSNILKANIHYIPLNKDFNNIKEILTKLKDLEYLQKMVNRTYEDIILSEKYSYRTFIKKFDRIVESEFKKKYKNNSHLIKK